MSKYYLSLYHVVDGDGASDVTPDKSEGPSDDANLLNYDDNNSLGGTALIQRTVELVSAHKMTISEMVEVSVDSMSIPQERHCLCLVAMHSIE